MHIVNAVNMNSYHSLPSPTTTMRWLSGDQERSLMGPANGCSSILQMCSGLTVSQILTFPDWSLNKEYYIICTNLVLKQPNTSWSNVESTRGVLSHIHLARVLSIGFSYFGFLTQAFKSKCVHKLKLSPLLQYFWWWHCSHGCTGSSCL